MISYQVHCVFYVNLLNHFKYKISVPALTVQNKRKGSIERVWFVARQASDRKLVISRDKEGSNVDVLWSKSYNKTK